MPRAGLDTTAVLLAAADIANREGLEAVTLASLAQKLDIRSPSLYNHVNGLGGLRQKMAAYALEKLHEAMVEAAIGRSGDEAVHALCEAYIGFVRRHPGLYEAAQLSPDKWDAAVQRAGEQTVGVVTRVLEAYGLEGDMALHAVRILRSLLHGFASLEQKGGFGLPLELEVTQRMLVESYLAGLEALRRN
jgi:AcrR family transcriptional regulator